MAIEFMDGRFDPSLTMREKVEELTRPPPVKAVTPSSTRSASASKTMTRLAAITGGQQQGLSDGRSSTAPPTAKV